MTDSIGNSLQHMTHNVILEDRHALTVSGVSDIDSFDEQTVIIYTELGELTVKGENLHINKLSLEIGELTVQGDIDALVYSSRQSPKNSGGFFSKVFR
ncbi:MAG: sporulation protein YabP [Clostridia bacterium]|nr:sporulation protein YabP [Clostridia bacterium]